MSNGPAARENQGRPSDQSLAYLSIGQGLYYVLTDIWPLVNMLQSEIKP
jgi:hypothetical protein